MVPVIKNMSELPAFMDVSDIKRLFNIGQRQAYELARSEDFPAIKIQGRIKIPKDLLIDWVKEKAKGAICE